MNQTNEGRAVLVAVDGGAHGWDALDWAAAEAAATGLNLHIVYVAEPPPAMSAWTQLPGDYNAKTRTIAEGVVVDAVRRARDVVPDISITTQLVQDSRPGRGIVRSAGDASLIVLGRRDYHHALRSRFGASVGSYVARRAGVPVVIAGLADESGGPSAGRVAVLVDGRIDASDAIALAVHAAQRRRIGITVLHVGSGMIGPGKCRSFALLAAFQSAFQDCDVTEQHLTAPVGASLSAASQGAALLVLGARAGRHIRRGQVTQASRNVAERFRTPVIIVPTVGAA